MRPRSKLFYFLTIPVILLGIISFSVHNKKQELLMIQYLKSESFKRDLFECEQAIFRYEKIFLKKPMDATSFMKNSNIWFNREDLNVNISDLFFNLNLQFETKDSLYFINSLYFNNNNNLKHLSYDKLSLMDAFYLNDIIVLDTFVEKTDFNSFSFPPEIYLIKNDLPIYNSYNKKLVLLLKQFSLEQIKTTGIKKSQTNRFVVSVSNDLVKIDILKDNNDFIKNHPKIKQDLISLLQGQSKKLSEYDKVYFSLYLFPEILSQ